tara:strand:+ start:117 stop:395 length:279 start_codon:yes stop_codon:yes gene_type:complete
MIKISDYYNTTTLKGIVQFHIILARNTDNIFSDLFEIGMFINMLEVMNDKELKYLKYKTEFTKDNLVSKLIPILSRLELKTRRQKKIEKILC